MRCALALTLTVVFFFAILLLYTLYSLERLRACNADVICQLYVVTEYTMVIIAATLLILIIIDVALKLCYAEKKLSSLHNGFRVVVRCPLKPLSTPV